jgi:hypothetical protein
MRDEKGKKEEEEKHTYFYCSYEQYNKCIAHF